MKATEKTSVGSSSPSKNVSGNQTLSMLVAKYKDEKSYQSKKSNWKDFQVGTKMAILREFCETMKYSYDFSIKIVNITSAAHTVVVRIEVKDFGFNKTIMAAEGISTQYLFNFADGAVDSCSERAQTIALGKALSALGISPENNMYSVEEMILFQQLQDYDSQAVIDRVSEIISKLPEEYKKDFKVLDLKIRDFIQFYDPEKDEAEFVRIIKEYIIGLKNERK